MMNRHAILLAVLLSLAGLLSTTGCASRTSSVTASENGAKLARAQACYTEGLQAEAVGDENGAVREYTRALRNDPAHPASLRRLATIHTARERYADAIPLWKRLVEATKGSADAHNDLGYAYDLAGYPDPAEASYLRGITADAANARVRTNYGLMLARHGRTNEAILQLRAAMPLADAHYNVAVILESQGKQGRAKREFERALDLDPDHVDAELHIAGINFEE